MKIKRERENDDSLKTASFENSSVEGELSEGGAKLGGNRRGKSNSQST